MHDNYLCPHCKGFININNELVFAVKTDEGIPGLIFLSSELGNYKVNHNKWFNVEHGKYHNFFCPICHKNLKAKKHPELIFIIMRDYAGVDYNIYFSGIAGEKSTFKVVGESVEIFGDATQKYMDYFNLIHMT